MRLPPALRFSSRLITSATRTPMVLIGSAVLLVVVGVATMRESYRGWKVDREIQALEQQADELEGRNEKLRSLARSLDAPERLEVEARTRLGLRMPGEQVVVLTGVATTGSWQGSFALDVVPEPITVERSNPERWFDFFFKPNELE
jgi:cell division protein FtsL